MEEEKEGCRELQFHILIYTTYCSLSIMRLKRIIELITYVGLFNYIDCK